VSYPSSKALWTKQRGNQIAKQQKGNAASDYVIHRLPSLEAITSLGEDPGSDEEKRGNQ
jgi:hypothetical protein